MNREMPSRQPPIVAKEPCDQRAGSARIDVDTLLQGNSHVLLVFRGQEYRLQVTRQGKLLLTK